MVGNGKKEPVDPSRFAEANRIAYQNADKNSADYRAWEESQRQPSEIVTIQALDKVRQRFRDPSSVKFRSVRWIGPVLVGEYQAKNALGGWSGWTDFTATL